MSSGNEHLEVKNDGPVGVTAARGSSSDAAPVLEEARGGDELAVEPVVVPPVPASGAKEGEQPEVVSPPASASSLSASSAAGGSELLPMVKEHLEKLAGLFTTGDAAGDPKKLAAANFIKALNDKVNPKEEAAKGGSRRALKRIMKKYSRRVSRKRGKRVKSSAQ